jgi:hypothetical protein
MMRRSSMIPPRVRSAQMRANLEAAHGILLDPDQHGGDSALAVRWARAVVAAHGHGAVPPPVHHVGGNTWLFERQRRAL